MGTLGADRAGKAGVGAPPTDSFPRIPTTALGRGQAEAPNQLAETAGFGPVAACRRSLEIAGSSAKRRAISLADSWIYQ